MTFSQKPVTFSRKPTLKALGRSQSHQTPKTGGLLVRRAILPSRSRQRPKKSIWHLRKCSALSLTPASICQRITPGGVTQPTGRQWSAAGRRSDGRSDSGMVRDCPLCGAAAWWLSGERERGAGNRGDCRPHDGAWCGLVSGLVAAWSAAGQRHSRRSARPAPRPMVLSFM